ncbi:MAG: purine nucleoside permease [Bacteroidota bacterium]
MKKFLSLLTSSVLLCLISGCGSTEALNGPIPIKVVVVNMFELGDDAGDMPGEFQYWNERIPYDESFPFPQGVHDLGYNRQKGMLGLLTGIGTAKAAASVMALGMDPRFDLSNAYWIISGIAGVDPEDASIGSAAWATYLVDGDLGHEIDAREIPESWETGFIPLRLSKPYEKPIPENSEGAVYELNAGLVDWAYGLTKDMELKDNDRIARFRAKYEGFEAAQKPPFVLKGDHLSASTFWHGKLLNQWANEWTAYWSHGKGNFVMSGMEDTGTLQALEQLDKADKVDVERVLVLRTGSNYTMQFPGITAAQSLSGEKLIGKGYSGYLASLEAAYNVANVVVDSLITNWDAYSVTLPGIGK